MRRELIFAAFVSSVHVLCVSRSVLAAGETTGRIAGYVYDPTGQALSDVPLTIHGSALLQPQERVSGEDGLFEFTNLPPGEDYEIVVEVEGFQSIRQKGITVRVGKTTSVDVHLNVLTEEAPAAEYQIVEKVNPVMNPDSAESISTVTAEQATQTPIFHQVEGIPQLAPGVSMSTRPSTRGGLARWGKFYVDGMDTTDITDGSITAPMNFDSVENFEVITGGFDAQYNSLGMVENAVTKSGSNRFTYDLSFTLAPPFSTAQNQFASTNPDYTQLYVNSNQPGPQTTFYQPIINGGGPIIKDRLWFYGSAQLNLSHKETPLTTLDAPMVQENRPTDTQTRLARFKLTWQPTTEDRVSLAIHYDHNTIDNVIANAFTSKLAEEKIDRGGYFLILNYDHNFTDNMLFQLQAGVTNKNTYTDPEHAGESHIDTAASNFTRFSLGSISFDQQGNVLHESKQRFQFDPTMILRLEDHQIKAGIQTSYQQDALTTGVTDGVRYFDSGGVCNPDDPTTFGACSRRTLYYNSANGTTGALITHAHVINIGAFAQDRWTINRNLTVIPGFRVDFGQLAGESGSVANLIGWGPRLSGTYDLFGDRKSLIVAAYGRSNDVGNIFIAQHANPTLLQLQERFDPTMGRFAQCDPTQPSTSNCLISGGPTGRSFAKDQSPPYVDEITAGFHQEVYEKTSVGVDATYRYYGNMWADQEVSRIYDPSGTVIDPNHAQSQLLTQARSDAYRRYFGLDFWVQGSPGNWDLLASYTLSYTYGTAGSDYFSDGYLTNPRLTQFYAGWSPDDQRHLLKGSFAYRTSIGLDLGMRVRYITGTPIWERFNNPADPSQSYYRSPRGTGFAIGPGGVPNFNDPTSWVEMRNPSQFVVDAQARYNLSPLFDLDEPRMELIFLIVNLFNSTDATALRDLYTAGANNSFGLVSSRQAPFQAELTFRVRN
jgi:hypothetical protein